MSSLQLTEYIAKHRPELERTQRGLMATMELLRSEQLSATLQEVQVRCARLVGYLWPHRQEVSRLLSWLLFRFALCPFSTKGAGRWLWGLGPARRTVCEHPVRRLRVAWHGAGARWQRQPWGRSVHRRAQLCFGRRGGQPPLSLSASGRPHGAPELPPSTLGSKPRSASRTALHCPATLPLCHIPGGV